MQGSQQQKEHPMQQSTSTQDQVAHQDPDQSFYGHPRPLKGLFLTELWERFSYYGIRPLLILYMSAMVAEGGLGLERASAAALVGLFAGSIYLMTIFGGWIADNWLGQAKSVWYGSIIIALGHLSIAASAILDHFFFYFGLVLIVLGTGLLKTCIAVIVGTLYSATDSRRDAGFSIFYMGINIGAFCAPLVTGFLVEHYAWHIGFGIGGLGMLIALITFRFYVLPQLQDFKQQPADAETIRDTPRSSNQSPVSQALSANSSTAPRFDQPVVKNPYAAKIVLGFLILLAVIIGLVTTGLIQINTVVLATYLTVFIALCLLLYLLYFMYSTRFSKPEKFKILLCFILIFAAALFWAALEQQPTAFNLFARDYTERMLWGLQIPTVWFQSLNPIFIVLFAPLTAALWIKLGKANKDPSYIVKFALALLFAALGYLVMALASQAVVTGQGSLVSPFWLVSSLFLLTMGELFLSPIGLSAMTKLSPTLIRGQIMGLWCTAIALGNLLAGLIGGHMISNAVEELPGLFMQCIFILCIGAIVLFLLNPVMKKHLQSQSNKNA